MKYSKKDTEVLKAQFTYGMALVGMALIQADSKREKTAVEDEKMQKEENDNDNNLTLEGQVFMITESIASIILPLIESLGALTEDDIIVGSQVGDDD